MNENEETTEPTTMDYVRAATILGFAVFGAYQAGKLGAEWAKHGVEKLKEKHAEKKED